VPNFEGVLRESSRKRSFEVCSLDFSVTVFLFLNKIIRVTVEKLVMIDLVKIKYVLYIEILEGWNCQSVPFSSHD
jgi:hypothetical protein